ncbi:MAG: hypothetical protein FIA99_00505 [Ruminiclostridium sp.]|nr:hypothetical protein [Ruminiclostridium sp.]
MRQLNILLVAAHPADTFDHCGGTLLHHARRGDKITAVSVTHGLRVHDIIVSEQFRFQKEKPDKNEIDKIISERKIAKNAEVIKACELLGVNDVRFLNYEDGILLVTEDKIQDVAKVIRDVKPDVILTHYPLTELFGCGSAHGNVGKIVLHASHFAGMVDFDDPNPSHRCAQIFFMAPEEGTRPSSNVLSGYAPGYCDYYVNITDVVEEKVKALDMMRSQQYGGDYARRTVEVCDGVQGGVITEAYAEGFIRYLPEYGEYLNVCEGRLDKQDEDEILTRKRVSRFIAPYVNL